MLAQISIHSNQRIKAVQAYAANKARFTLTQLHDAHIDITPIHLIADKETFQSIHKLDHNLESALTYSHVLTEIAARYKTKNLDFLSNIPIYNFLQTRDFNNLCQYMNRIISDRLTFGDAAFPSRDIVILALKILLNDLSVNRHVMSGIIQHVKVEITRTATDFDAFRLREMAALEAAVMSRSIIKKSFHGWWLEVVICVADQNVDLESLFIIETRQMDPLYRKYHNRLKSLSQAKKLEAADTYSSITGDCMVASMEDADDDLFFESSIPESPDIEIGDKRELLNMQGMDESFIPTDRKSLDVQSELFFENLVRNVASSKHVQQIYANPAFVKLSPANRKSIFNKALMRLLELGYLNKFYAALTSLDGLHRNDIECYLNHAVRLKFCHVCQDILMNPALRYALKINITNIMRWWRPHHQYNHILFSLVLAMKKYDGPVLDSLLAEMVNLGYILDDSLFLEICYDRLSRNADEASFTQLRSLAASYSSNINSTRTRFECLQACLTDSNLKHFKASMKGFTKPWVFAPNIVLLVLYHQGVDKAFRLFENLLKCGIRVNDCTAIILFETLMIHKKYHGITWIMENYAALSLCESYWASAQVYILQSFERRDGVEAVVLFNTMLTATSEIPPLSVCQAMQSGYIQMNIGDGIDKIRNLAISAKVRDEVLANKLVHAVNLVEKAYTTGRQIAPAVCGLLLPRLSFDKAYDIYQIVSSATSDGTIIRVIENLAFEILGRAYMNPKALKIQIENARCLYDMVVVKSQDSVHAMVNLYCTMDDHVAAEKFISQVADPCKVPMRVWKRVLKAHLYAGNIMRIEQLITAYPELCDVEYFEGVVAYHCRKGQLTLAESEFARAMIVLDMHYQPHEKFNNLITLLILASANSTKSMAKSLHYHGLLLLPHWKGTWMLLQSFFSLKQYKEAVQWVSKNLASVSARREALGYFGYKTLGDCHARIGDSQAFRAHLREMQGSLADNGAGFIIYPIDLEDLELSHYVFTNDVEGAFGVWTSHWMKLPQVFSPTRARRFEGNECVQTVYQEFGSHFGYSQFGISELGISHLFDAMKPYSVDPSIVLSYVHEMWTELVARRYPLNPNHHTSYCECLVRLQQFPALTRHLEVIPARMISAKLLKHCALMLARYPADAEALLALQVVRKITVEFQLKRGLL